VSQALFEAHLIKATTRMLQTMIKHQGYSQKQASISRI
jgi:hypothetical protein